ncbi:MAG: hypothetical protein ACFCA4_16865 [Cyanophyceae cyanobacterium]
MKISRPTLIQQDSAIVYQAKVESSLGSQPLWFSFPPQYRDLVSDRADGALVAMLLPAMILGEDVSIDGPLSERLYYNLSGRAQGLLTTLLPQLNRVKIHAEHLDPALRSPDTEGGVATGFSGGVDSFCALADHLPRYNPDVVPSRALTHLLYNNVGSHGSGGEGLFRDRYRTLENTAKDFGLPFVSINSNIGVFYEGFSFEKSHTLRNTAAALVLQRGISAFLYASAFDYSRIQAQPGCSMGSIDPMLLPLLGTETFEAIAVGSEYTRAEKISRLTTVPETYTTLDVCASSKQAGNCCQCAKCLWALVALEATGKLDKYSGQFNLDRYYQIRDRYLPEILLGKHLFSQELLNFAESQGYAFPAKARLLAKVPFYLEGRNLGRKIRDRLRKK